MRGSKHYCDAISNKFNYNSLIRMVPLHHRTKFTESGEKSPPVPPPPPQRGRGEDAPLKKLREKMACR